MKEQEAANKKVDVVEMYSVPKVTEEAQKMVQSLVWPWT